MDILEEIIIKAELEHVILRFKNSLEWVKEKQPTRIDIIEPMQDSCTNLIKVQIYMNALLQENKKLKLLLNAEKVLNLELKAKQIENEKTINNLIDKL